MQNVTIVVAVDQNLAIGKNGLVPWRLSADMKHFAEITTGKIVVMGRKTFDSLPARFKPLPNRENIILTRSRGLSVPGCTVANTVQEVLHRTGGKEIYIIGGAEIYNLFLPYTNCLIVTHVETLVPGADTFFPQISTDWNGLLLYKYEADEKNKFPFSIVQYSRIL